MNNQELKLNTEQLNFSFSDNKYLSKIYSFFNNLNDKYFAMSDLDRTNKRKFPIIAALNADYFQSLKNRFLTYNFKIFEFNTENYNGIYFESSPKIFGIVVALEYAKALKHLEFLNRSMQLNFIKDLVIFGKKNNLNNLIKIDENTILNILNSINILTSKTHNIKIEKLNFIEYKNSHNEYKKNYFLLKNRKYDNFDIQNMNEIEMFSLFYYWEIKIIKEFVNKISISIYDTGTCHAHFPLLLSVLSAEDLMGLNITKILASDIYLKYFNHKFVKKIIKENNCKKRIDFFTLDLIKDISKAPTADIIIINDVLEHLPSDEISFTALKKLWDKTGELLIAHVPFEDKPNPTWGHNITFNEKKIREWANCLPGAHFLSDVYPNETHLTFSELGFIIIKKNNSPNFKKVDFYNHVHYLTDQLNFKVYIRSKWLDTENLNFPVLGAVNNNHFNSLEECLSNQNYKIINLETVHYHILYFENSSVNSGLFISPKIEFVSLDKDILNIYRESYLMNELKNAGKMNGVKNLAELDINTCALLWHKDKCIIAETKDISIFQVYYIFYKNNYKQYLHHYKKLLNKNKFKNFNLNKNTFLETECIIFCWKITIIAEILKNKKISILDIGTHDGYFPLLLSKLSQKELNGLNISQIYAVDQVINTLKYINLLVKDNESNNPVQFMEIDWINNIDILPDADVIIINFKVKYFIKKENGFSILRKLWNKSGKLLIIKLLLGKQQDSNCHINNQDIINWSKNLSNSELLSDKYFIDEKTLTEQGFFIINKKISNKNNGVQIEN